MSYLEKYSTRKLTGTALKFSLDVQNPLVVSSDELSGQRAVILDSGQRVD